MLGVDGDWIISKLQPNVQKAIRLPLAHALLCAGHGRPDGLLRTGKSSRLHQHKNHTELIGKMKHLIQNVCVCVCAHPWYWENKNPQNTGPTRDINPHQPPRLRGLRRISVFCSWVAFALTPHEGVLSFVACFLFLSMMWCKCVNEDTWATILFWCIRCTYYFFLTQLHKQNEHQNLGHVNVTMIHKALSQSKQSQQSKFWL